MNKIVKSAKTNVNRIGNKNANKNLHVNHPSQYICEQIGQNKNVADLLIIKDTYNLENKTFLLKIKPKFNGRTEWIRREIDRIKIKPESEQSDIEKDFLNHTTMLESNVDEVTLEGRFEGLTPLDTCDGIVYDMMANKIVCRYDNTPACKHFNSNEMDEFIDQHKDELVMKWIEGTIIVLFKYNGQIFRSTRSRLDLKNTIINREIPNCPKLGELWDDACKINGIDDTLFIEEGVINIMLLVNKYNQIINTTEVGPMIYHVKSYKDGQLIDKTFDGIQNIPMAPLTEYRAYIKNGGVVITNHDFVNFKLMCSETYKLYELRSNQNLEMTYYVAQDLNCVEMFIATLPSLQRDILMEKIKSIPEKQAKAEKYIQDRYLKMLKNPEYELVCPTTIIFASFITKIKTEYYNDKKTFYNNEANKQKKFFWGQSKNDTNNKIVEVIRAKMAELTGLQKYKLIRDALKLIREEEEMKNNDKNIGGTFGSISYKTKDNKYKKQHQTKPSANTGKKSKTWIIKP